jgi:uncharacterized protein
VSEPTLASRLFRIARKIVTAVIVAYAAIVAFLYVAQRSLQYPLDARRVDLAKAAIPRAEEATLTTPDGERIIVWIVPPESGKPVLVFFPGNGGTIANRATRFRELAEDGVGLVAVSYRGYGGSTGSPSESGLNHDAHAAYDEAVRRFGAERIVLYGQSLGTGVVVRLATEAKVKGLILEAPYFSAAEVTKERYPFAPIALLMKDQFRSGDLIGQVRVPVLIMHGERDGIIPFGQGMALFNASSAPRRFVRFPAAGHNDLPGHGADSQMLRFLADLEDGRLQGAQLRSVGVAAPQD